MRKGIIRGLQGAIAAFAPQRFFCGETFKTSRQQYAPSYKMGNQRRLGTNNLYKRRMG